MINSLFISLERFMNSNQDINAIGESFYKPKRGRPKKLTEEEEQKSKN